MRFPFLIKQNVSKFNVAMENAALMRVMNSAREFGNQFHRTADRHWLTLKEFVKRAALNEFHAEVARPITLADLIDRNDGRTIQACRSLSFQLESLKTRWGSPLTYRHDL